MASAEAIPGLLKEHLEPLADRHAFAADDASGKLRRVWRGRGEGELSVRQLLHGTDYLEGVDARFSLARLPGLEGAMEAEAAPAAEAAIHDMADRFGLSPGDLSLDLGPLGRTV